MKDIHALKNFKYAVKTMKYYTEMSNAKRN